MSTVQPVPARIVALGEAMVEFNQRGGDAWQQGFGGDTSNMAIAAARQGAAAAYVSRVGDDTFGRALCALWRGEGVDVSGVEVDPAAPTGVYFVSHGPVGHEFSYLRAGSAASRMTPALAAQAALAGTGFLHVSGISQAISASACDTVFAAVEAARAGGARISYDPNLRLKLWPLARARAIVAATLALVDWALPSAEDLAVLSGHDDAASQLDWCHAQGAAAVVLKRGANGCIVSFAGERMELAGVPSTVVDATGAGDCFDGAFVARLMAGDAPVDAARYANVAAALSVRGVGAIAPIPRRAAVLGAMG
jgi:2-dehydro-3-deoxygluconokinase